MAPREILSSRGRTCTTQRRRRQNWTQQQQRQQQSERWDVLVVLTIILFVFALLIDPTECFVHTASRVGTVPNSRVYDPSSYQRTTTSHTIIRQGTSVRSRTRTRQQGALTAEIYDSTSTRTSTFPKPNANITSQATGFYVHIPYCRRRCRYCDFAIVPIGIAGTNVDTTSTTASLPRRSQAYSEGFLQMDQMYRDALLQEIQLLDPSNRTLTSIYFGGGTPSLAPTETIQTILTAIRQRFHIATNVEITMEMDPGTFDEVQLQQLCNAGINRISLGVQALDDAVLAEIGRVHRVQDIYNAIDMIRRIMPNQQCHDDNSSNNNNDDDDDHNDMKQNELKPNFSIDLISGLPGVSLAQWTETLETTVRILKPSHVSIYDLQIEQGTVFGKWYADDDNPSSTSSSTTPSTKRTTTAKTKAPWLLPSPDDCAYMYRYASGYLRHEGYEHYEISSYSLLGKRSRHNQVYWGYDTEWFACGLGSTSFLNNDRCTRPRAMSDYIDWVKQQQQQLVRSKSTTNSLSVSSHNDSATAHSSQESPDSSRLADIVMTRLRTSDGFDLEWLRQVHGDVAVTAIVRGAGLALELGLANIDNHILRLKDPQGFLFSNFILSSIFVEMESLM